MRCFRLSHLVEKLYFFLKHCRMYLSLCKLSGKPSIKQHNAQFSCHFSLLSNYRVNEFRTKRLARTAQVGLNSKNPPKMRFFEKCEIDWLSLCHEQFDKFLIWCTCNDRKRLSSQFAETSLKNSWNDIMMNLFFGGF